MAVSNGQDADQTTFNNAFVSRTLDSDTIGKVGLKNTSDLDSGATIDNAQRLINENADATGVAGEGDATRKDYSSNNVVANGDDRKVAIGKLDAEFNETTGHNHDGTAGNGAPISADNLSNFNNLFADWVEVDRNAVSGTTFDVTSDFAGKVSGGDASNAGVITASPGNRVELINQSDFSEIEDGGGLRVYGRISFAASVWTLNFFVNNAGVETAYNLPSTDIKYFYREVFTAADRPTIGANVGLFDSLNAVQDIPDATAAQPGKVSIGAQTFGGTKEFDSRPTTGGDPLVSEVATQTLTNKTIQGASIEDPTRLDVKKDTEANLITYASTATDGQLAFATDTKIAYVIYDNALQPIGSGSGGGGGGIDVFATETYEETVAADLSSGNGTTLVGGTFQGALADDNLTPISQTNSIEYTQAVGSGDDWFNFFPSAISLDPKQQGQEVTAKLSYTYDGNNEEIRVFAYSETAASEITIVAGPVYLNASTSVATAQFSFFTAATDTSIRIGALVEVENDGAVLVVDDIELKTNGQILADSVDEQYAWYSDFAGRGSTATKVAYFTNERRSVGSGLFSITNDSTDGFQVTALRPCTIEMKYWSFASSAQHICIGINADVTVDPQDLTAPERLSLDEATTADEAIQTTGSYSAIAGDVLTPHTQAGAANNDARWGITVTAIATNEVVVTATDNIQPARYTTNAGQSIPNSTRTIVNFEDIDFDDSGTVTVGGSWSYTAKRNMYVDVKSQIQYNASAAASTEYNLFTYVDGASYSRIDQKASKDIDGDSNTIKLAGSDLVFLEKNQTLDIRTSQNSGGAISLANPGDVTNYVSITPVDKKVVAAASPAIKAVVFRQVETSGAGGGSATGGDAIDTRVLNDFQGDATIGSLSSNQMTIQPGTYLVEGSAPAYQVAHHKIYLYNVTDATNEIIGSNNRSDGSDATGNSSFLKGYVTLTSAKVFELRHQTESAGATTGLGTRRGAFGTSEVYGQVSWLKIG